MTTATAAAAAPPPTTTAEEDADGMLLLQHDALGTDLSYLRLEDTSEEQYEASLQKKVQALRERFQPYWSSTLTVFRSPPMHHRLRAKFGIGRVVTPKDDEEEEGEEEEASIRTATGTTAAAQKRTTGEKERLPHGGHTKLCYLMWGNDERPVAISSFPLASRRINELMPRLLLALETGPVVLRRGLRAVNFLDTLAGDTLISLMYQVPLLKEGRKRGREGSWAKAAGRWVRDGLGCQVVGRSKGRVVTVDRAYVIEEFDLFPSSSPSSPLLCGVNDDDEEEEKELGATSLASSPSHSSPSSVSPPFQPKPILRYKQWEGAFSNPNGHMAIHTLHWLCARADAVLEADEAEDGREGKDQQEDQSRNGSSNSLNEKGCEGGSCSSSSNKNKSKSNCDLLELYCGGGNHTVALSRKFRRVVGVEIDRRLVAVARENLLLNGIENTTIIQIPSEKFRVEELGRYRRQQEQQERREREAAAAGVEEGVDVEDEKGKEGGEEDVYDFGVVLVDPPRAGLDRHTRKLVSQYDDIWYISCGPLSLLRDLRGESEEEVRQGSDKTFRSLSGFGLAETHEVIAMCVLDHFPGTMHIEAAVHLRRRL